MTACEFLSSTEKGHPCAAKLGSDAAFISCPQPGGVSRTPNASSLPSAAVTGCELRTDLRFEISRGQKRIKQIKMVASTPHQRNLQACPAVRRTDLRWKRSAR
jgi:hypothetical protein